MGSLWLLLALAQANELNAVQDNRQLIFLNGSTSDSDASCLDGSPFAFWIWPGNSSEWSVFINGGGWCLNEEECEGRTKNAYGSSRGYNITGPFAPAGGSGDYPVAYTCQGLDPNCTRVYLPYCDGSCFTSMRNSPWPVPGTNSTLHFKGLGNMERTLDVLAERFGLAQARRLVLSGGSAGGLSTYLHLDRVSDRLRKLNPDPAVSLQVVGRPVAGFFIDAAPYTPSPKKTGSPTMMASSYPAGANYSTEIKFGTAMFNSTPALSPACRAAHSGKEWKCWMAPTAFPFVREPIFAVQSRFDEFQLMAILRLPCAKGQSFAPPYKPSNCTAAEHTAIDNFGAELLSQFAPVLSSKRGGAYLVSCIQHDVHTLIANVTEEDAFASWMHGGSLGKSTGYKWVDHCGPDHDGATPCNTGAYCAPM
jgi:hypothetical protein